MEYIRHVKLKGRLQEFFTANYCHPMETVALILHYKVASLMFFGLFFSVTSSFYASDPMECWMKYDRSKPPYEFEDICLTYPYTYNDVHVHTWQNRVFALHYKWVHWAFLFLVVAYHLPLYLRKYHENKHLNLYLTMLNNDDTNLRKELVTDFIHNFMYTQQYLYKKILLTIGWLIALDIGAFAFFDVVLQNRFARLIPLDYPFEKWPQYFNDTMSLAFPQFIECSINQDMMIISRRTETLGCRLTLMPMYEKCFIVLWFLFVLLFLFSIFSLVYYLCIGMSKGLRKNLIYIVREDNNLKYCVENLSTGDVIALHCLQRVIPSELFRHALREVRKL